MVKKNAFFDNLRNKIMPKIDDPRKRFLSGLRNSLAGTRTTTRQPRTSRPRRRSGVRAGRPTNTQN